MKRYPHVSYVPPEYLYPSPEPFPSLPYHVLQELRNRITAPDVLSFVPQPSAAPKTRPKLSLSTLLLAATSLHLLLHSFLVLLQYLSLLQVRVY